MADNPSTQLYRVKPGDNLESIAEKTGVPKARLIAANPQVRDGAILHPGDILTIPKSGDTGPVLGTGGSELERFPVSGRYTLAKKGGPDGVEVFAARGTPVVSPVTGVVVGIEMSAGAATGLAVTVRRGGYYFHLMRLGAVGNLREGQAVKAGDRLGSVGATGTPQGQPRLLFAVNKGGSSASGVDPRPMLEALIAKLSKTEA